MGQQERRPNVYLYPCLACLQSDFIDLEEVINKRGYLKSSTPVHLLLLGKLGFFLGALSLVNKTI